ncbi:MAG: hypothetical protein HN348_12595 [Proteobacteria bacterium]|nr:hypothetical protein [Pseudomonadota bacterium]
MMEIVFALGIFALSMIGLGIGILIKGKAISGSCHSAAVHGPDKCACGRKDREMCPTNEPLVALAQISYPDPKRH